MSSEAREPTAGRDRIFCSGARVQPERVTMLQSMVRQSGLIQIQPLLGAIDDVKLPASSVDLAVMVDV